MTSQQGAGFLAFPQQAAVDGLLLLVRLERPKETPSVKVRIIARKGKHPVGDIGRRIAREEVKAALADFPCDRS